MIYCKLSYLKRYKNINANLDIAIDYIINQDLYSLTDKKVDICPNSIYAFQSVNELKDNNEIFLEGHRFFIDIQIILDGVERFYLSDINESNEIDEYNSDTDYQKYTSCRKNYLDVSKGELVIVFPEDIHGPGYIAETEITKARKIVFKVKVN